MKCKLCGQDLPYPRCGALLKDVWPKGTRILCGKKARYTVNGYPRCGHHSKPGERESISETWPDSGGK